MQERIIAREIRERCKGRADPQVIACMEAIAEQAQVQRQQILDLAQQLDLMTNILNQVIAVAGNMKDFIDMNAVERISRKQGDVDSEPTT